MHKVFWYSLKILSETGTCTLIWKYIKTRTGVIWLLDQCRFPWFCIKFPSSSTNIEHSNGTRHIGIYIKLDFSYRSFGSMLEWSLKVHMCDKWSSLDLSPMDNKIPLKINVRTCIEPTLNKSRQFFHLIYMDIDVYYIGNNGP